jgi:hypothetical protein
MFGQDFALGVSSQKTRRKYFFEALSLKKYWSETTDLPRRQAGPWGTPKKKFQVSNLKNQIINQIIV